MLPANRHSATPNAPPQSTNSTAAPPPDTEVATTSTPTHTAPHAAAAIAIITIRLRPLARRPTRGWSPATATVLATNTAETSRGDSPASFVRYAGSTSNWL